jgi:hypothetical protein
MQITDVRPERFTSQIRCDRCGLLAANGEVEFHEMTCIDAKAGYGSIFGDGSAIQIDLCQNCLKLTLGPWLRVTDQTEKDQMLKARLSHFDLNSHGGEFPFLANGSLEEPENFPAPVGSSPGDGQ